jgi:hypothetical protein
MRWSPNSPIQSPGMTSPVMVLLYAVGMTHETQFCLRTDVPIVPAGSPATRYLLLTSELGEALEVVALNRAGEVGKARRKVL